MRKEFIEGGQLQEEVVEAYQRQVERFQELLLILIHTSGGQSARALELLGIRWKNTEQGGIRNIFIEDGLVTFVTTYHKGYRNSGNIKIIHQYLPREISELRMRRPEALSTGRALASVLEHARHRVAVLEADRGHLRVQIAAP